MATPNFANRTLYHGDNLPFLRGMNSATIHLIATDPPFNKGRDFHATPASPRPLALPSTLSPLRGEMPQAEGGGPTAHPRHRRTLLPSPQNRSSVHAHPAQPRRSLPQTHWIEPTPITAPDPH